MLAPVSNIPFFGHLVKGYSPFLQYSIELFPAIKMPHFSGVMVVYRAGYAIGKVPADLASACMELAAWNMNRCRGRRIGMAGNVRGGKDGEHFEMSMPEQVRLLLEPYWNHIRGK